jgi:hypothetical protein
MKPRGGIRKGFRKPRESPVRTRPSPFLGPTGHTDYTEGLGSPSCDPCVPGHFSAYFNSYATTVFTKKVGT